MKRRGMGGKGGGGGRGGFRKSRFHTICGETKIESKAKTISKTKPKTIHTKRANRPADLHYNYLPVPGFDILSYHQ